MKLKLRPAMAFRNILKGNATVQQTCCAIQVYVDRKWSLLGDDNGPMYFKTASERNAKLAELQGAEIVRG